jgi:hypothetical protein
MIGELGLPGIKKMRQHIERLRDRQEYLQDCVAEAIDMGERPNPWHQSEIDALTFAITLVEDAWDNLVRMHKEATRLYNRQAAIEGRGGEDKVSDRSGEWHAA